MAEWWSVRRAQSHKPTSYRCPLCDRQLHAMTEHLVIAPEGDVDRRRHAHTECVLQARKAGTFRTYEDWRETQPGLLARLFRSRRIR